MRVISGSLRSRPIRAPRGDATRPTSDRVRESLFAVLGDVGGLSVLDLYAGSGALAIEAISRGAKHATCVESARAALVAIKENVATLGLADRVSVVARRVSECAAAIAKDAPFDLVFADPPWALVAEGRPGAPARELPESRGGKSHSTEGSVAQDLATIAKSAEILAPNALIVLEHAARDAAPTIDGVALEDARRWGDTAVAFYRRVAT